ncbi:MAG: cation:proton antiporter [Lachnospiraceae bacterium]|nr:cation:proton antiporter [Lachnospiraceae bacterium]
MLPDLNLNILTFLAIAIIFALLSSKVMKLVKLPNVTGYLIIGLLLGPFCLNVIPADAVDTLSFIPTVALGFIAFSIGAEFKLSYLKKVGKTPVVIAVCESLGAVLVVDLVLILTGNNVPFSLCLGAIAAATAPAATLMVVKQYKAKGELTETLLAVVAIDDATALMFFGISVAIAQSIEDGGTGSVLMTILKPIAEILGSLLLGAVFGVLFRFLVKWFTGRGNRLSVTYAMVFACIGISDLLGLSALLACMILGAVLVNTSNVSDKIFEQTDRMTPPLFMLFFFLSGAGLDITLIPQVGVIGILYVLFRIVGKVAGAALGGKMCHAPAKIQKYLGFTLVPQAGVAIGLATTALKIVPDYGPRIKTIILCGTVIYELTGPVITKLALKAAGEIDESTLGGSPAAKA